MDGRFEVDVVNLFFRETGGGREMLFDREREIRLGWQKEGLGVLLFNVPFALEFFEKGEEEVIIFNSGVFVLLLGCWLSNSLWSK